MDKKNFDEVAKQFPVDDPEKLQAKQYNVDTPLTKKERDTMGAYLYVVLLLKLQFGSAFWFLHSQVPEYKTKLADGGKDGFEDFVKNGVVVGKWDKTRSDYWTFVLGFFSFSSY